MSRIGHGLRRSAPVVSGGAYNPVTAISWAYAYWAEGADFVASGPIDGTGVSTWHDEIGSSNFTTPGGSTSPHYIAAATELGNKPAIRFRIGQFDRLDATWGPLAQPNSLVIIGAHNGGLSNRDYVDSLSANRQLFDDTGGVWRMLASSSAPTSIAADDNKHLFIALYNGASSTLQVDGTVSSTVNPGTNSISAPILGFSNALNRNPVYAFIGWKSGALTAGEISALRTWSQSYYGTP